MHAAALQQLCSLLFPTAMANGRQLFNTVSCYQNPIKQQTSAAIDRQHDSENTTEAAKRAAKLPRQASSDKTSD